MSLPDLKLAVEVLSVEYFSEISLHGSEQPVSINITIRNSGYDEFFIFMSNG